MTEQIAREADPCYRLAYFVWQDTNLYGSGWWGAPPYDPSLIAVFTGDDAQEAAEKFAHEHSRHWDCEVTKGYIGVGMPEYEGQPETLTQMAAIQRAVFGISSQDWGREHPGEAMLACLGMTPLIVRSAMRAFRASQPYATMTVPRLEKTRANR